jgi:hypothetical protein
VGDRRLPGAEDRLAPDRALTGSKITSVRPCRRGSKSAHSRVELRPATGRSRHAPDPHRARSHHRQGEPRLRHLLRQVPGRGGRCDAGRGSEPAERRSQARSQILAEPGDWSRTRAVQRGRHPDLLGIRARVHALRQLLHGRRGPLDPESPDADHRRLPLGGQPPRRVPGGRAESGRPSVAAGAARGGESDLEQLAAMRSTSSRRSPARTSTRRASSPRTLRQGSCPTSRGSTPTIR